MPVKPEYRAFKQLINEFRYGNRDEIENTENKDNLHTLKIEPKLIYNTYSKTLKMEVKIGVKKDDSL